MAGDKLDRIDRKILNALQRDCQISNVDLARKVGTSPPSCLRRTKRLRKMGLIQREIALLDPSKVERKLIAITEISLNVHNSQQRDQVIRRICDAPEVTQCYNITGAKDIIIISYLKDMEDFEAKISERLNSDKHISLINTYFVIKTKKFEPFIYLDEKAV